MMKSNLIKYITALLFLCLNTIFISAQSGWTLNQIGEAKKDFTAVFFIDSKRGCIGGEEGLFLHTDNGGATWIRKPIGTNHTINDIYFRNKENGFILAGNTILTSVDSGETWRELKAFKSADFKGATPELYSIRFGSKKRGWIVGSLSKDDIIVDSVFLYTEDGGTTWQRRGIPTQSELIHLDFVSDERGWVVGADGTILYTEDGGASWSIQKSGVSVVLYHVNFQGKKKGWAVGQKGTLLRTTDGGKTWAISETPTDGALYVVKFINDDIGWVIGRNGSVLLSNDGGKTWIQQDSKTTKHLYDLFMDKKGGWAIGSDGVLLQYVK